VVTYAVVDARTGSMLSSHPSFDAARAELPQAACDHADDVAIYVFDDTGYVAGLCACADAARQV
jgi:hypothetical protein